MPQIRASAALIVGWEAIAILSSRQVRHGKSTLGGPIAYRTCIRSLHPVGGERIGRVSVNYLHGENFQVISSPTILCSIGLEINKSFAVFLSFQRRYSLRWKRDGDTLRHGQLLGAQTVASLSLVMCTSTWYNGRDGRPNLRIIQKKGSKTKQRCR